MLVKVRATGAQSAPKSKRCTDVFRGQIVDVGPTVYTVQDHWRQRQSSMRFSKQSATRRILEVVRSGVSGIARGEKSVELVSTFLYPIKKAAIAALTRWSA